MCLPCCHVVESRANVAERRMLCCGCILVPVFTAVVKQATDSSIISQRFKLAEGIVVQGQNKEAVLYCAVEKRALVAKDAPATREHQGSARSGAPH